MNIERTEMTLLEKAHALGTFKRLIGKEIESYDKQWVKLAKSNGAVMDKIKNLRDTINFYEALLDKVDDWQMNVYDQYKQEELGE